MKEGETVFNYFSCTLIIANEMCFHGEIMTDVIIIEKILRNIEKTQKLSIAELQSSLLVYEQHMQTYIVEEQALKITHDNSVGKPGLGGGAFLGRG